MNNLKILLVEDDDADAALIGFELQNMGLDLAIERAVNREEYITQLSDFRPDLILSDFNLIDFDGLEALGILRNTNIEIPFILVTGNLDEETAVSCIKLGAWDYILKDKLKRLIPAIENALKLKEEIYEKNRALNDLKKSEAKYQDLYDNAPDMFFSVDLSSHIVINCNKTLLKELGYVWDEFVGKEIFSFLTLESAQYARKVLYPRFIKTGIIKGAEQQVLKRNGTIMHVWLTNSVVYDNNGRYVYSRSIWRDITERKKIEEELKAERISLARKVEERTADLSLLNSQLAKALRMKDEFLANMSHELRTPLNAILGLSEVLLDEIYGQLNQNQTKSLLTIEESGRHLLSLINDILDIAKIEAGKVELEIQKVSLHNLAMSSLNYIKQVALKRDIRYSLKYNIQTDQIWADERRLKQILINLLSNAVKFTPTGGEIGLDVTEDGMGNSIIFTVWDNGIGIKQEDFQKLFKPFKQIDSSLAREYAGTGLGLSLVKSLTELHGGSVTVESNFGKGSTFKVSIPLQKATQNKNQLNHNIQIEQNDKLIQEKTNTQSKQLFTNVSVLIVEDNDTNIALLSRYLKASHFRILVARNGDEAIEIANNEFPDIILMDIQMPGKDGIETTQIIRKSPNEKLANVPIIALTALAMPGDKQRCLMAGMNEYIVKPLRIKELLEIISKLVFSNT
jgi:PAS domain S-box-containing protein